ncbi:MAG: family 10 glycosylhydrolase, partial [Alloprevotella sp.]|nr:family 10 glycosylhydrolase [Alloprevotella sp.]
QGLGRDRMQKNLTRQLDALQDCGVNVVLFQVRVEADALYPSLHEPWSRFLTGVQGQAPHPLWDPLEWMVGECHRRGMELHAWINPYRAKTKGTAELAENHPARRYPDRFFQYDGLLIFDPGRPENRDYICTIARDIVNRNDVDGLHIDDYFYPYPAAGQIIPDDATFSRNHNGFIDKNDWRRYNVNLLVRQLHETVHQLKPWVKFGVSPFGIYHNDKGDNIPGSATNGLQNYDDLYADVLYWIDQGWVDYTVPQLYWEIGHKAADYATLARWWGKYASKRPLVIGQDVERTVKATDLERPNINQMPAKFTLQRSLPGVAGSCLWYSAAVARNEGNFATALKKRYHKHPALQPAMPFITETAPKTVRKAKVVPMDEGRFLFWTAPKAEGWADRASKYVVYRFRQGEPIDTDDPAKIFTITDETFCPLPSGDGTARETFVITPLNRIQNEGKAVKKRVRL